MFEDRIPGGPNTYCELWTEKFAATCDIICRLVVMPTILKHGADIYVPTVNDREAAQKMDNFRRSANEQITGLYLALRHNDERRWGNKADIPLLKKTATLGKRTWADAGGSGAVVNGVFRPGGHSGGALQD
jgi:hypothetical protein